MKSDVVPDRRKYVPLDDAAKKLGYKSKELEKKAFTKLVDVRSVGNIKYLDRSVFEKITPVETHSAEWGSASFIQDLFSADSAKTKSTKTPPVIPEPKKEEGIKVINKRVEIKKESVHSAEGTSTESELKSTKPKKEAGAKKIKPKTNAKEDVLDEDVSIGVPDEHDELLPKLIKKDPEQKIKTPSIIRKILGARRRPIHSVGIVDMPQTLYMRIRTVSTQKISFDFVPVLAMILFVGLMFTFTQAMSYMIFNKEDLRVAAVEAVHKPGWALNAMILSAIDSYRAYAVTVNKTPQVFEKTVGETMYALSTAIYDRNVEIYEAPTVKYNRVRVLDSREGF